MSLMCIMAIRNSHVELAEVKRMEGIGKYKESETLELKKSTSELMKKNVTTQVKKNED